MTAHFARVDGTAFRPPFNRSGSRRGKNIAASCSWLRSAATGLLRSPGATRGPGEVPRRRSRLQPLSHSRRSGPEPARADQQSRGDRTCRKRLTRGRRCTSPCQRRAHAVRGRATGTRNSRGLDWQRTTATISSATSRAMAARRAALRPGQIDRCSTPGVDLDLLRQPTPAGDTTSSWPRGAGIPGVSRFRLRRCRRARARHKTQPGSPDRSVATSRSISLSSHQNVSGTRQWMGTSCFARRTRWAFRSRATTPRGHWSSIRRSSVFHLSGGNGNDIGYAIAVDSAGSVYCHGRHRFHEFPWRQHRVRSSRIRSGALRCLSPSTPRATPCCTALIWGGSGGETDSPSP